jgi:hypothetical protein
VHGSGVGCVVIHARPSEGKEGELISINKYKKSKRSKECCCSVKKMMQSWLKKLAKKEDKRFMMPKKGW